MSPEIPSDEVKLGKNPVDTDDEPPRLVGREERVSGTLSTMHFVVGARMA